MDLKNKLNHKEMNSTGLILCYLFSKKCVIRKLKTDLLLMWSFLYQFRTARESRISVTLIQTPLNKQLKTLEKN